MFSKRVLIVDDDSTVSRILSRVFSRAGFEISTAANGLQALDLLHANSFDAMVCDIQMPHMTGRELIAHLTTKGPYLPGCVFIATSRSEHEERSWVNEHPGVSLVEKPVSPKQLLRLVRERLDIGERAQPPARGREAA